MSNFDVMQICAQLLSGMICSWQFHRSKCVQIRIVIDELLSSLCFVSKLTALWDSLLENRIRLQRMLLEVNKLPQHDVFDEFKEKGGSQIKGPLNNSEFHLV